MTADTPSAKQTGKKHKSGDNTAQIETMKPGSREKYHLLACDKWWCKLPSLSGWQTGIFSERYMHTGNKQSEQSTNARLLQAGGNLWVGERGPATGTTSISPRTPTAVYYKCRLPSHPPSHLGFFFLFFFFRKTTNLAVIYQTGVLILPKESDQKVLLAADVHRINLQ